MSESSGQDDHSSRTKSVVARDHAGGVPRVDTPGAVSPLGTHWLPSLLFDLMLTTHLRNVNV